jgi:hypothetical protein
MKKLTFYLFTTLLILGVFALVAKPPLSKDPHAPRTQVDDYTEECLGEGCSAEEVNELYASYQEECLVEGCSPEEVFELAGPAPGAVNAMLTEFKRRGFKVRDSDFQGAAGAVCTGTTTECYGFFIEVMICDDHCTFPDGSTSASYPCGLCIGFDF